jgi:hypothetical protein
VDAEGKAITDPENATLEGSYTEFCGYFKVGAAGRAAC